MSRARVTRADMVTHALSAYFALERVMIAIGSLTFVAAEAPTFTRELRAIEAHLDVILSRRTDAAEWARENPTRYKRPANSRPARKSRKP